MNKVTREEVQEAFFNIGRLAARIPSDEGKRLTMLISTVSKYIKQLEAKDDFDIDGRC